MTEYALVGWAKHMGSPYAWGLLLAAREAKAYFFLFYVLVYFLNFIYRFITKIIVPIFHRFIGSKTSRSVLEDDSNAKIFYVQLCAINLSFHKKNGHCRLENEVDEEQKLQPHRKSLRRLPHGGRQLSWE